MKLSGIAPQWLACFCLVVGAPVPGEAAPKKPPAAVAANCVAFLGNRFLFGEASIRYRGSCPTGFAEGARKVVGSTGKPGQNDTFEIDSTFVRGKPSGQTTIRQPDGLTFVGELTNDGDSFGTTTLPNGDVLIGEGRQGIVWRAIFSSRSEPSTTTRYLLRGDEVPQQLYAADLQGRASLEAILNPSLASTCVEASFDRRKRALCKGQPASGVVSVRFRTADGKVAVMVAEFSDGLPAGPGRIDIAGTRSFIGVVAKYERAEGITRLSDGRIERGVYKSDRLYAGTLTAPGSSGAQITATLQRGKVVDLIQTQIGSSAPLSPGRPRTPMTKVRVDGDLCLADLPSTEFKIQAEMPGRCRGWYYTGNATLTLTPLRPGLPRRVIKLEYQDGLTGGPALLSLPGGQAFRGTLSNWGPEAGEMTRPLGNDNYEVILYSRGRPTARRVEHREPTEAELAARQIMAALLQSAIRCATGQCPGDRQQAPGASPRSDGGAIPAQAYGGEREAQSERDRITAANCGYAYSRTVDPRYCAPKFDAEGADRANAAAARRDSEQVQADVRASDAAWRLRMAQEQAGQRAARETERQRIRQEQVQSEHARTQMIAEAEAAQKDRDRITAANCGYTGSRTVDPRYCAPNFNGEAADRAYAETARRHGDQVQAQVRASDAEWRERIAHEEGAQRAAREAEQLRLRQAQAASAQARTQQAAADRAKTDTSDGSRSRYDLSQGQSSIGPMSPTPGMPCAPNGRPGELRAIPGLDRNSPGAQAGQLVIRATASVFGAGAVYAALNQTNKLLDNRPPQLRFRILWRCSRQSLPTFTKTLIGRFAPRVGSR